MKPREAILGRPALVDLQQIDGVCDRFEKAWLAGRRPNLVEFLGELPSSARPQLFRDLLSLELEYRRRLGEEPDARSYHADFPEFATAIASAFEQCASQPTMMRRESPKNVQAMTAGSPSMAGKAHNQEPGFTLHPAPTFEESGYEILGELGRGGMGVVFKARQIALNRIVALKVVKSGRFATPVELIRFQTEAEAVAQLDHPNIVPIYEVSQGTGNHYFSMKLVSGASLDRRLEQFAADPRASAHLAATVARAVHHAHQRGILHRDLKPANVLVDEAGQPHVTDFGLAKRLDAESDATQSGALVGTPSYMSPEQVSGPGSAVSTATDIYGLGTVLYALLAGRAPFAGTTLVETLEKVRTQTPEPPGLLNSRVPRDLEIICLKCLEKEPQRRYQSALELAEDLERWIDGKPIVARPVGRATRLALWCRRNRALASLALVLAVSLVVGIAGITWKWREADHERAAVEAVNELLVERLLAGASLELDPYRKDLTVREMIDRSADQLGGWLEGQPEVLVRVREMIAGIYLSLDLSERAGPQIESALRLSNEIYGPQHRNTIRINSLMAEFLDRKGRYAEAEAVIEGNVTTARRSLGATALTTLDAAEKLGAILWHRGKLSLAEAVLRTNVSDRRRVLKPEHPKTLRSVYLLSRVLRRKSFRDAEEQAYAYAHSIQCSLGSNHPEYVFALANLADVYREKGDLKQAERHYAQASREARVLLGDAHPTTRLMLEKHAESAGALKKLSGANGPD